MVIYDWLCSLLQQTVYSGTPDNEAEVIHHFKYLVRMVAPILKQFDHDQMVEKETEAKIRVIT